MEFALIYFSFYQLEGALDYGTSKWKFRRNSTSSLQSEDPRRIHSAS
jgi:hypothetical protein